MTGVWFSYGGLRFPRWAEIKRHSPGQIRRPSLTDSNSPKSAARAGILPRLVRAPTFLALDPGCGRVLPRLFEEAPGRGEKEYSGDRPTEREPGRQHPRGRWIRLDPRGRPGEGVDCPGRAGRRDWLGDGSPNRKAEVMPGCAMMVSGLADFPRSWGCMEKALREWARDGVPGLASREVGTCIEACSDGILPYLREREGMWGALLLPVSPDGVQKAEGRWPGLGVVRRRDPDRHSGEKQAEESMLRASSQGRCGGIRWRTSSRRSGNSR